jgi:hypothetical protein
LRSEPDDPGGGLPSKWEPFWSQSAASTSDNLDIPGFLKRELLAAADEVKTPDRKIA